MKVALHRTPRDKYGRHRWDASFRGRIRHRYEAWRGIEDDPEGFRTGVYYALRVMPDGWKNGWGELEANSLTELRRLIHADAIEQEAAR